MKKQHLDPHAKRDFSVLSEHDKERVREWLTQDKKTQICPFWFDDELIKCPKCSAIFPEVLNGRCPCSILYIKDVIEITREAVR